MESITHSFFCARDNWLGIVISTVCGTCALFFFVKWFGNMQVKSKINKARKRRAANLLQAERAVCHYNDSHSGTDKTRIHSLSLRELRNRLKEGSLRSEDVIYSYLEKALEVNKRLNCCTEILMENLDQLKTGNSNKECLLYGVPVSIKENLGCKGHDSTSGIICNLDEPALENSVIVEVLKRQGAIPFVKTNVPQSLLSYDCSNPIYGQTMNPHHPQKTPGGSSGGEAALIAGGGSLLGIGTDIGGSIRIPSSFCGICGIKPTAKRLSSKGISACIRGQKSVSSSVGPMARDVDSLALCMQALLCEHMFDLDPTVPPIPFNMEVYQSSKSLRIGYFENDGYQHPSPSIVRGLREVQVLLEQVGHTFVPFKPLKMQYAMHELAIKGLFADGGTTLLHNLKGNPIDPCVFTQIFTCKLPKSLKALLSILLKPLFPRIGQSLGSLTGFRSVQDLWKLHAAVEDYVQETIAEWRRCEIDVLLCPALGPAYNMNYCGKLTCAVSTTIIFNLLNFPAGVVPVGTVTAQDEIDLKQYKGNFGDPWDMLFKRAVTGAEGLPVAVQCVALPWQDELCLRFMREVETLIKERRQ